MQRSYRKKEIIKVKKIGRVRHKKAASVDRWGEKKEERTENKKPVSLTVNSLCAKEYNLIVTEPHK